MPLQGRPDWSGVPLVHGANKIATVTIPLGPSGGATSYQQFNRPGYLVNIRPFYTGATGATPFCRVHLRWSDANPLSIDLGEVDFLVPIHASGVYVPVIGGGPVRGPFGKFEVTNLDPAQSITFAMDVWETTQHIARDDWRDSSSQPWVPAGALTGAPGASPGRNKLAAFTTSLTANQAYLMPLYAGQASLSMQLNPVGGGTVAAAVAPQNGAGTIWVSGNVAALTAINSQAIILPREPCNLQLFAPATGGNFTGSITALEYAS